jgi:hypothetical protein
MTGEIPGELRMVADDLLLVDGFKVDLGAGAKFGELGLPPEPAFFLTLEGRVNKSQERRTVHVMLTAEFGYQLGDQIMGRLEEFVKLMRAQEQ